MGYVVGVQYGGAGFHRFRERENALFVTQTNGWHTAVTQLSVDGIKLSDRAPQLNL